MRKIFFLIFLISVLTSCSHKRNLIYLDDLSGNSINKINFPLVNNKLEIGDVLKIDVQTVIPEAATPYNQLDKKNMSTSFDLLIIEGYFVDENFNINYPILGRINVIDLDEDQLSKKIAKMLVDGGHLTNPHVKVRKINSKFTVLGEVRSPGTFSFYDKKLNIFQALGYAGDLLITAKRKKIKLVREENGVRKIIEISLSKKELLEKPYYVIKNNDILIVEPNFSKVKSAGFIGSPSSIASISSLLLSVTLLIINN